MPHIQDAEGAAAEGSQAQLQLHGQARVRADHTLQSKQQSGFCIPKTTLQACMLHQSPDAAVATPAQTAQVVHVQQCCLSSMTSTEWVLCALDKHDAGTDCAGKVLLCGCVEMRHSGEGHCI